MATGGRLRNFRPGRDAGADGAFGKFTTDQPGTADAHPAAHIAYGDSAGETSEGGCAGHAAKVAPNACPAAPAYLAQVNLRKEKEAQTLASLTGWDIGQVRNSYGITRREPDGWQRLFNVAP